MCFVAKGVHAALCAQVRIGTGLEIVIVVARCTRCVKVARLTWAIVAWTAVVELTWLTLTLRAVVRTRWTVTKLFGALTIASRTVADAVTAHMAVRTRGSATFTTTASSVAATASGFVVANTLHHFTTCGLGRCGHHVTAWGLA